MLWMKLDSPAKGKKPDTGESQGVKDLKIQNWKALRKIKQICDYQELGQQRGEDGLQPPKM